MADEKGGISPPPAVFPFSNLKSRRFSLIPHSPPSSSSPNHHLPPFLCLFLGIVRRLLEAVPCKSWSPEASSPRRNGRSR
ncbi:hypothetical protein RHMOL_Rhmol10G0084500 [Rhododendron molle]|uniref:Uncharacterized protein n=1 Tax=Rhododendron molle TaxID=49168 RepID=A0ACC0LZY7_RHOML|nr:hypothetical protein RHMOL_Rhmol10G0084500 [Rhododendron molle]